MKRQKNLPGLIPHTHFAEIHNYGSKRGRRRVRVPKARIKTVPLEFSEVGTQVSEVQKWFEAGITHNVGKIIFTILPIQTAAETQAFVL